MRAGYLKCSVALLFFELVFCFVLFLSVLWLGSLPLKLVFVESHEYILRSTVIGHRFCSVS